MQCFSREGNVPNWTETIDRYLRMCFICIQLYTRPWCQMWGVIASPNGVDSDGRFSRILIIVPFGYWMFLSFSKRRRKMFSTYNGILSLWVKLIKKTIWKYLKGDNWKIVPRGIELYLHMNKTGVLKYLMLTLTIWYDI